jgi:hypothetical protein
MRRLRRILRIVEAAMRFPSRRSSPWMGTTPHVRFSVAGLTTNVMIFSFTGGRPGGVGWCHFPATNRRCDRSNVCGDTVRHVRIAVGGQRDNAASMARSDQNSRGVAQHGYLMAQCQDFGVLPRR